MICLTRDRGNAPSIMIPASGQAIAEHLPIGNRDWTLLRAPSVDVLYQELLARGDSHEDVLDERIPYWADLWPSAIALAEYLAADPSVVAGRTVTEIGCGLGLPGLVAASLDGIVTMTDYLDDALAFTRRNAATNGLADIRFAKMDWRRPDTALAADVLLASDVAYESRMFGYLPAAFRALTRPGGVALVSEPCRAYADAFFKGLSVEVAGHEVFMRTIRFRGQDVRVNIHRMTMAKG